MKRKLPLLSCVLTISILFTACAGTAFKIKNQYPIGRDTDAVYELVVLHTNDHHGTTLSKDNQSGLHI